MQIGMPLLFEERGEDGFFFISIGHGLASVVEPGEYERLPSQVCRRDVDDTCPADGSWRRVVQVLHFEDNPGGRPHRQPQPDKRLDKGKPLFFRRRKVADGHAVASCQEAVWTWRRRRRRRRSSSSSSSRSSGHTRIREANKRKREEGRQTGGKTTEQQARVDADKRTPACEDKEIDEDME